MFAFRRFICTWHSDIERPCFKCVVPRSATPIRAARLGLLTSNTDYGRLVIAASIDKHDFPYAHFLGVFLKSSLILERMGQSQVLHFQCVRQETSLDHNQQEGERPSFKTLWKGKSACETQFASSVARVTPLIHAPLFSLVFLPCTAMLKET